MQTIVAHLLRLDYRFPQRTEIVLEGLENLPQDRSVFIAMNHTDRYNYWPLQFEMWRRGLRYTVTWVKGKYYENAIMGAFMDAAGNIPIPSKGYALTTAFRAETGRLPETVEYRALRDLLDGREPDLAPIRALLGARTPERWCADMEGSFAEMIREVTRLNRQAIERDLHVIVFPEGTRTRRLGLGHTGLAQMSQHLGASVVPVGCNGSDKLYPANVPFSKGGRVVYRIGAPLEIDGVELGALRVEAPFAPLSTEASRQHGQAFRAITTVIMDRINDLLDPEYQYGGSDAVMGARRFV